MDSVIRLLTKPLFLKRFAPTNRFENRGMLGEGGSVKKPGNKPLFVKRFAQQTALEIKVCGPGRSLGVSFEGIQPHTGGVKF